MSYYYGSGPDRHGKDAKRVMVRLSKDENTELETACRQFGKKVKRYDWRTGKTNEAYEPCTKSELIRQAITDYIAARKTESLLEEKKAAAKTKRAATAAKKKPAAKPAAKATKAVTK